MKPVLIAPVLIAALAFAAPAAAREDAAAAAIPVAAVDRADLDLATEAGAATMLKRLRRAVAEVCSVPEIDRPSPALRRQMESCREAAMDEAVADLGAPEVTRQHEGARVRTVAASR